MVFAQEFVFVHPRPLTMGKVEGAFGRKLVDFPVDFVCDNVFRYGLCIVDRIYHCKCRRRRIHIRFQSLGGCCDSEGGRGVRRRVLWCLVKKTMWTFQCGDTLVIPKEEGGLRPWVM